MTDNDKVKLIKKIIALCYEMEPFVKEHLEGHYSGILTAIDAVINVEDEEK